MQGWLLQNACQTKFIENKNSVNYLLNIKGVVIIQEETDPHPLVTGDLVFSSIEV